jgi:glycosyltransferase involved in cell wall biosynthesis
MNELAVRRARRIVTEYRAQAEEIFTPAQLERARPKLRTVYTGHPVPELARDGGDEGHEASDRPFTVGTMGAFSPRKNQRALLEAARLVRERVPGVRFAFAGEAATSEDEAYAASLRDRCRETGLDDAVEWCGWVEAPHEFLGRLDLYVQTSEHEGLPGAVREAMLDGLPVVATGVGGTPEIVVEGETGHLVERGDVEAIAAAIARLANDRPAAAAMGTAGRRRAEELFSRESFLGGYRRVLEEVLATGR